MVGGWSRSGNIAQLSWGLSLAKSKQVAIVGEEAANVSFETTKFYNHAIFLLQVKIKRYVTEGRHS